MILTDKQTKMENQKKQFKSLEYFNDKVAHLIVFDEQMKMIEEAFEEAKKMYEEEIKKAFERGFEEGEKHMDTLVRSDERFLF